MTEESLRGSEGSPLDLAELGSRWLEPSVEADFALPTVSNFIGLVQASWGPTGIQNWVMPPTGLPTATGQLYELDDDDRPRRVGPAGTRYRWLPWEIQREHEIVSTVTRLGGDAPTVTETITFHRGGRYVLVFQGLCRTWRFTDYWNLPPEDVPQVNVAIEGSRIVISDCKTFASAVVEFDRPPGSTSTYMSLDEFYSGSGAGGAARLAAVRFDVAAGDTVSWTAAQGTTTEPPRLTSGRDAESRWRALWADAFTPGNGTFGGHLPALRFGDDRLDRLYYMGVLTLLHSRREARPADARARFATGGQAIWSGDVRPLDLAYTWGGSEGAPTTSFLWEVQLQAPLLARLDPRVLRNQLEAILRADMSSHWGIDVLTGQGVGMWYGVNDGAIVTSAYDYLRITGDADWLDVDVAGRTVREHLLGRVLNFEILSDGSALGDFGSSENLLECVGSYQHKVAAFNAQAAWCYRYAADVLAPERSEEFRARAEEIEAAVRGLLGADGVFSCETPTGRIPVRTCLDFIYVGRMMGDRLDEDQRAAMLGFFTRELETGDWMRALSHDDANSQTPDLPTFQTFRADHQSTGSYDGWPGLSASVRLRFGDVDATLDWLRRVSAVTWEGPFGQAHWVGTDATALAATKASFFNGNCYLEACGCSLATTLLEDVAPLGLGRPA